MKSKRQQYYIDNKEIIKKRCLQYYYDNKEKINRNSLIYYHANKHKWKEYHKKTNQARQNYYNKNKDKLKRKSLAYYYEKKTNKQKKVSHNIREDIQKEIEQKKLQIQQKQNHVKRRCRDDICLSIDHNIVLIYD